MLLYYTGREEATVNVIEVENEGRDASGVGAEIGGMTNRGVEIIARVEVAATVAITKIKGKRCSFVCQRTKKAEYGILSSN